MMATMDKFGRFWPGHKVEQLCLICGQPRPEDGVCLHQNIAAEPDAAVILGGLSMLGLRVAVMSGGGGMVTYGTLKEVNDDEVVVQTRGLDPRRIRWDAIDRVTGPYFEKEGGR
jgi:hypothetical protein